MLTAKRSLQKLIRLNREISQSIYESGRILYVFKETELYKDLGYNSLFEFSTKELPYAYSTACQYIAVYREFKRLKYKKSEALRMLDESYHGNITLFLQNKKKRVSVDSVIKSIDKHRVFKAGKYNLLIEDKDKWIMGLLEEYGMYYSKSQVRNMSSAIIMALTELQEIKKQLPARKKAA